MGPQPFTNEVLICKVRVITTPTRTKQVLVVNPSPGPDTGCLKDTSSKETRASANEWLRAKEGFLFSVALPQVLLDVQGLTLRWSGRGTR